MQDPMHDDDPAPSQTCSWCKKNLCECDSVLACGVEKPEQCESCT